MGYRIKEMAHIGCSVYDLDEMLEFLKTVPGLNNIKTQFIDYPYLAGVVGITGCAINIGFARRDKDKIIELLDYVSKNETEFPNSFLTVGSGFISYACPDIKEAREKCLELGAQILLDMDTVDGGPFAGKKHFFVAVSGIWLEFIEGGPAKLVKAGYIVSNIARSKKFFRRLSLTVDETIHKELAGEKYAAAYLRTGGDNLMIELLEPENKRHFKGDIRSDMTGNVHCCFLTEGIEDLFGELCDAGAVPQGRVTLITHGVNAGAYAGYLTAPGGIKIELFQGKPTKI